MIKGLSFDNFFISNGSVEDAETFMNGISELDMVFLSNLPDNLLRVDLGNGRKFLPRFSLLLENLHRRLSEEGKAIFVGNKLSCLEYYHYLSGYPFVYRICDSFPGGRDENNSVAIEIRKA